MQTFVPDTSNELFQLAVGLVNQSSRHIFLTGKAGTGKTTFLKYIKETCPKQLAVVAPTGVAAINAGGVTIHSFLQLPLSPFIPAGEVWGNPDDSAVNKNSLLGSQRMTREKRKVLQELELLIIDEVSMVRCDTLDAVDTVLRHVRKRYSENFGGIQVLFIGDMYQLPPVINDEEWELLSDYYSSPYFFDSRVIKEDPPVFIEFEKIYRQSEEKFIDVLNQVRNNCLGEGGRQLLESRYNPYFKPAPQEGYIILTTHNEKARIKNDNELKKLAGSIYHFDAEVTGDFPEAAYPADATLQLKVGAQVMFIKNDTEKIRRYYNGKIGIVTEVEDDKIKVQCPEDSEAIEVTRATWENIRYRVDKTSRQLKEEVLGTFTQYPLRLAWAITIHKSQGLTFDKAIIDAGQSFAPGQVYVALSRCTALNGIVLQSRIRPSGLFIDERIIRFSQNRLSPDALLQEFRRVKENYRLKIYLSLFDYKSVLNEIWELKKYFIENKTSFNEEAMTWAEELSRKAETIQTTALRFQRQIEQFFQKNEREENTAMLVQRLQAAVNYFANELETIIGFIQSTPVITDSRNHAKEINDVLREIFVWFSLKQYLLTGFPDWMDAEAFHRRKKKFTVPPFSTNTYAGAPKERTQSPHPVLHQRLRKLRDSLCAKTDLPVYFVAGSRTLDEMARYLPQSLTELRKINGFGDAKIKKYGQQFLNTILEYCREKNIGSLILEKTPLRGRKAPGEKKGKSDTKLESFKLYKQGKTVDEIAAERQLTRQTIEGHLAHYVVTGDIDIYELVSPHKIALIESELRSLTGNAIAPLKEKLGDEISYGEIRLVKAWLDGKKT
jgi:DNA-binding CsgD family transcriptional regulator